MSIKNRLYELSCFCINSLNYSGVNNIQLVKKPSNEITLYMMFEKGLRLTIDTTEKMKITDINYAIKHELQRYRPSSYVEYESSVNFLTRYLEQTFTGDIQSLNFEDEEIQKIQLKWHESMFLEWLKMKEVTKNYPYELVRDGIVNLYSSIKS